MYFTIRSLVQKDTACVKVLLKLELVLGKVTFFCRECPLMKSGTQFLKVDIHKLTRGLVTSSSSIHFKQKPETGEIFLW